MEFDKSQGFPPEKCCRNDEESNARSRDKKGQMCKKIHELYIDFFLQVVYDKIVKYGIPARFGITFMKEVFIYGKA